MDLLDIAGLAGQTHLPESLVRYYRDRFILFVPTVRVGRLLLHPPDAIGTIAEINRLASQGAGGEEIEEFLQRVYPVSVFTARPLSAPADQLGAQHALTVIADALDERGARIEARLQGLHEQIDQAAAAPRAPDPGAMGRAGIELVLAGMEELHGKLGTLASREQLEWIGDVVSAATSPAATRSDPHLDGQLARLADDMRTARAELDLVRGDLAQLAQSLHEVAGRDRDVERGANEREPALQENLRQELLELRQAMQHREVETTRALRGLVHAMRAEMTELRATLSVWASTEAQPLPTIHPRGSWQSVAVNGNGAAASHAEAADGGTPAPAPRPPRRLGQLSRSGDEQHGDGVSGMASGASA